MVDKYKATDISTNVGARNKGSARSIKIQFLIMTK